MAVTARITCVNSRQCRVSLEPFGAITFRRAPLKLILHAKHLVFYKIWCFRRVWKKLDAFEKKFPLLFIHTFRAFGVSKKISRHEKKLFEILAWYDYSLHNSCRLLKVKYKQCPSAQLWTHLGLCHGKFKLKKFITFIHSRGFYHNKLKLIPNSF